MAEKKTLTLGSLFDGSGGFPLGGILAGVRPIFSSEIEPFPVLVTHRRLPQVKHYGDVSKLKGSELEPVDIITFGSPCQDLSIAGKRAGIHEGQRSNLFFEAIRIIREMREATNGKSPRYAVWENVCFDADTLVTCEDGYRRIADIAVGQKVKTLSGKYHPVMKVHQTKNREVVKLRFRGGENLIVTPNHPVYAMRKVRSKKSIIGIAGPEWVPAGELTEDHLVAYGIDQPSLPESFMGEPEAWAVGRWLADGSVDLSKSNPRMFFSIGIGKEPLAREMLGKLPYKVHENKPHPTATNFCFTSKEFYSLIAEAGRGAGHKRVPPYVFQLPHSLQKAVLDGYISGDGYIRTRGNVTELYAGTASRELAYGISRLIRNVYNVPAGITVSKARVGNIGGREIKPNFPTYHVTAFPKPRSQQFRQKEGIIWQPVRGVEKVPGRRTVYNLSVLEDNTYAANDIIVHNCGALSSNGGRDFKAVLEAVIGVREEGAEVPPPENYRWPKADVYLGDGWSVAYRTLDTQYWSCPQRRARIYLVADFAGGSAPEVLFESEGMSGYTPQGFRAWEGAAGGAEKGAGEAGGRPDAGSGVSGGGPGGGSRVTDVCVNPQGSSGITVTEGHAGTLVAQDHGNHPAVLHPAAVPPGAPADGSGGQMLQAAGFSTEHSAKARSIGYGEEVSPTLRAGVVPAAMLFDNHPQDCRYDGPLEDSPTVTARYGTGGNTQPLVAEPKGFDRYNGAVTGEVSHTLDSCAGNTVPMVFQPDGKAYGIGKPGFTGGKKANFNFAVNEEVSPTLQASGSDAVAQPENPDIRAYGVCGKSSYSMLSDNPKAGFYEAKTSRTLDASGGFAVTSNQGGICIVAPVEPVGPGESTGSAESAEPAYSLQGSMVGRKEKNGPQGSGINEEVAFTLNTADRHCVAAPLEDASHYSTSKNSFFMHPAKEQANTLVATDYKDPPILNDMPNEEPMYIVRRLTPVECARLQGFPDWWCAGLADPDPSPEEMAFWKEVWDAWNAMNGKKPKTEKQLRKWLADPHTDAAEYKLWGNGLSLPLSYFVLSGIVWAAGKDAV